MPDLVLGPLHRYAGETDATIWVETSGPCEVEVLGAREPTFAVGGHHYALVVIDGLERGRTHPYEVRLDGERVWPEPGSPFPPSVIRTLHDGDDLDIVFGSCRVTLPHEPPYTLSPDDDAERGRGWDALLALALRMRDQPVEAWPERLLLLGDQVYVDEGSPATRERIRRRRGTSRPPHAGVLDYEEYTWVYRESWGDPALRWLLSTVPTAMIWDDHDMHDDWNVSAAWVREMRRQPWWSSRIEGGIMSYWVYQHLGNLTPEELRGNDLFARVRAERGDAGPLLREHARRADREVEGTRWSYARQLGRTRLVVLDSRAGRVLEDTRHAGDHEHARAMIDDGEWAWVEEHVTGDVAHLLIASSLPVFMLPGLHDLEGWNEAICDGAWGPLGSRMGERIRRAVDLEHWSAFQDSFHRLARLLQDVAAGRRGEPPETICLLGGDVHHAYLSRVHFGEDVSSNVVQAVCSPFRNELDRRERAVLRFCASRAGATVGRALRASARVEAPDVTWEVTDGPFFDNQVATLRIRGTQLEVVVEKTRSGAPRAELEACCSRRLA